MIEERKIGRSARSLTYWQRKAGLESVTTWKMDLTEVVWAFGWQYSLAEA